MLLLSVLPNHIVITAVNVLPDLRSPERDLVDEAVVSLHLLSTQRTIRHNNDMRRTQGVVDVPIVEINNTPSHVVKANNRQSQRPSKRPRCDRLVLIGRDPHTEISASDDVFSCISGLPVRKRIQDRQGSSWCPIAVGDEDIIDLTILTLRNP